MEQMTITHSDVSKLIKGGMINNTAYSVGGRKFNIEFKISDEIRDFSNIDMISNLEDAERSLMLFIDGMVDDELVEFYGKIQLYKQDERNKYKFITYNINVSAISTFEDLSDEKWETLPNRLILNFNGFSKEYLETDELKNKI